jgi:arabinogalactan oligomer/maltooligosaccharide transport system substrate-binding protein
MLQYQNQKENKRMKKQVLTLVSLMLIASFALAACGTPATPTAAATEAPTGAATEAPTAAPTEAPAMAEVTFWHAYGTGSAEEVALTKALEQAAVDLPNIKINVLQVPFNDIYNKYSTDVAAGGGPDMFIAPNDNLGDEARSGLIADITDLAAGKLDGYSQTAIDGMSLDGALYGIPESLKAVVLWYNKDLVTTPPATTDDLKALMDAGTAVAVVFNCYHDFGFYNAFGGQIFDENWKVVADQNTGVADAMTYLDGLYQTAKTAGWPLNDGDALAPFQQGEIAAVTNGNWAMNDYRNSLGDKLGVVALPAGPSGPAAPMLGVDGFYFSPNSANPEAALEVALYLTSAKIQEIMMTDAGHAPARTDVNIADPLMTDLLAAFNAGNTIRPQVTELGLYWSNFCGQNDVFEGGMDPTEWVTTATANANK